MTSTTSIATLRELRRLFAQFGFPQIIVSDNGTQFTSVEFQNFCRSNGIKHVRAPPFHPQSDGQAERFVDTFKRLIGKMKNNGPTVDALHTFLFTYRNTPCTASPDGRSPAENFLGRRLRSTLDLLKPGRAPEARPDIVMEEQFNRRHGAKPRKFEPNDFVFARNIRAGQSSFAISDVSWWLSGALCRATLAYQFESRIKFPDETSLGDYEILCLIATIVKMINEPVNWIIKLKTSQNSGHPTNNELTTSRIWKVTANEYRRTAPTIRFPPPMKAQNLAKLPYFEEFQYGVFKRSGKDSSTPGLPES
ncbi:integrase core domain protein [Teladorsagia circumcincta]|uniref:Integrase core domain protein n=1 Tax=Teladorsagia circumcincta TaxID=45464 RepID=A0A2G9UGG4_TELCI|nr:integrase core domain protein [Teladorsagia circumcincta]